MIPGLIQRIRRLREPLRLRICRIFSSFTSFHFLTGFGGFVGCAQHTIFKVGGQCPPYTLFAAYSNGKARSCQCVLKNTLEKRACVKCSNSYKQPDSSSSFASGGSLKRSLGMDSLIFTIPKILGFEAATYRNQVFSVIQFSLTEPVAPCAASARLHEVPVPAAAFCPGIRAGSRQSAY